MLRHRHHHHAKVLTLVLFSGCPVSGQWKRSELMDYGDVTIELPMRMYFYREAFYISSCLNSEGERPA